MEDNKLPWTHENLDRAVLVLGDILSGGKLVMVDNRKPMQTETHASRKRLKEAAEAQARAQMKKVKPVDSPQFKQQNTQAKAEFEHLVRNYSRATPWGKTDHTKTKARREQLQKIFVQARDRDVSGNPVVLYTSMLEQARAAIRQFEHEDAKRSF